MSISNGAEKRQLEQLALLDRTEEASCYHASRFGYFALLHGSRTGKKTQRSYRLDDMHRVLPLVAPDQDTWLSQGEFLLPNRRVVNLARIGLQFCDLDYYRIPAQAGRTPEEMAITVRWFCQEELDIPAPSLMVASGQGLQLKWLLDTPLPKEALPRWNAVQREIVNRLAVIGADPLAKDASRYLRLVDTLNTKSNEVCRVIDIEPGDDPQEPGQPRKYNFEWLCEQLLPEARWDVEARKKAKRERQKKARQLQLIVGGKKSGLHKLPGSRLAWDRLNDLRKLADLRGGYREGERMLHLFWQLNFLLLSGATHSSQMWHEAAELARQIDKGWGYHAPELGTLYRKAKAYNAGEKVEFNGKQYPPLYTPWNSRLIDLFQITDDEQKSLKTIVSKAEAEVREKARDAKRKGWTQTQDEYQAARKDRALERTQRVLLLKSQGFKYAYIAEKMDISINAVKGIVKRAKASEIKGFGDELEKVSRQSRITNGVA